MRYALSCGLATILLSLATFSPSRGDLLDRMAENGTMVGDFSGVIVPVYLPTEQVTERLPEELLLEDADAENTLVLLIIGQQRDVHFVGPKKFVRFRPEETKEYHEVIIAVPDVCLQSPAGGDEAAAGEPKTQGPYTHFAKLYLDSERAIDLGRRFWGYPKHLAAMRSDGRTYRVASATTDDVLLEAAFEIGDANPSLRKLESYAQIEKILQQPIALQHEGEWVFKSFDWNLEEAAIAPAAAQLTIGGQFWSGLSLTTRAAPLGKRLGSFHLRSHWESRQINGLDQPAAVEDVGAGATDADNAE